MKTEFIDQKSVRKARKGYSRTLKKISEDGRCPFCIENIRSYHTKPIIAEKKWLVTENMFPYTRNKHHILLIAKRHICRLDNITQVEWNELFKLIRKYMKMGGIDNGGFFVKFGNTTSVRHLHFHIVQDTRISKVVL